MEKFNLVKMLESIGFEAYHSGGGCWAMIKDLDNKGNQIWITDNDAGIEGLEELEIDEKGNLIEKKPSGYGGVCGGFFRDGECYFQISDQHGFTLIDALEMENQK